MNTSTTWIVVILCLAIGMLLGLLISYLLGNRPKTEEELKKQPQAEIKAPAGSGERPAPPVDPFNQFQPFDQARLWRDAEGGPLKVEVDGMNFTNPDLLSYDQRRRMEAWFENLQVWLGHRPAFSGQKEQKPEPPASGSKDMTGMGDNFPESPPKKTGPLPPAKSIVFQIDAILQDQISGTPLADRGIRLAEAPGQGVMVWLGLNHFQGIDAVPDPEVQAAIRKAVKTWEAQAK